MFKEIRHQINEKRDSEKKIWKILMLPKDFAWQILVFLTCNFSKIVLHPLWRFKKPQRFLIRPVILTCDRNIESTKKFILSYKERVTGLQKPILFADTFDQAPNETYLNLLKELNPEAIVFIKKVKENRNDNIEHFIIHNLVQMALPFIDEMMLFLEDDIIFSSKFTYILQRLSFKEKTGLITLYSPYHEYLPIKTNGLVHTIRPEHFYGNQAVLFFKKTLEIMSVNAEKMDAFPKWYDRKWAHFFKEIGYNILATNNSYVQHAGNVSRLRKDSRTHTSYKFIK